MEKFGRFIVGRLVNLCLCKALCRSNLGEAFAASARVIDFSRLDLRYSGRAPCKGNYGNRWDESANQSALGTLLE